MFPLSPLCESTPQFPLFRRPHSRDFVQRYGHLTSDFRQFSIRDFSGFSLDLGKTAETMG